MNLEELKKKCLVFDLETSATYPDGTKINIRTNFDDYVQYAKAKWFGCYSYKYNKYVLDIVEGNEDKIKDFIGEHDILIGFNNEEFDTPILANNNLLPKKWFLQVDNLIILGSSSFHRHDGLPFKNRGELMGYKFKTNSLKAIAKAMELETQKGDIDYNMFFQTTYTDEERKEVLAYLKADIDVTKQMFEKLWEYWKPFTEFLIEQDIKNLSWIRSSIASLTYKCACKTLGVEATYADKKERPKEEMGGRVIEPKYEEATNVWYLDFASLYPHVYTMFNLFAEVNGEVFHDSEPWHGNKLFKVKGYYDISEQHKLSQDVAKKLKTRITLKETDPENPMIYTLKIFLNSLYGAQRSTIFEKIHTPNGGWDCCWLSQQIQEYTEKRMGDFGFETIAGDTDSIFVVLRGATCDDRFVKSCLAVIVKEILVNVPFPAETFNIDIENFLPYVMWPFSMQPIQDEQGKNIKKNNRLVKKRKGKKKNYLYIYEKDGDKKLKIVGLPIKKDNATLLGPKILKEVLEPNILISNSAKFPRNYIEDTLSNYLDDKENLRLLSREYKVKPFKTYKKESQLQAQISKGYFNEQDGVIFLIKNKVCGKAGKTAKYCTVEEAHECNLEMKDMDLTKINNELEPFVEEEK
jgi:DNA polymerase elongation subunit (family B)